MTDVATRYGQGELQLPFPRPDVLHLSPLFAELRLEVGPVVKVTTPTGDPAWLVIGYDEARAAFSERSFGYYTHPDPPNAPTAAESIMIGRPIGGPAIEIDMLHKRRLLTPAFSPKRMKLLHDWIQQLTDQCLDEMEAAHEANPDQPIDFHAHLGWRLPVLVIGALLGVPDEDRDYTMELSDRMGQVGDDTDAIAASRELQRYMEGLLEKKRGNYGEDVISDLARAQEADPNTFTQQPLAYHAAGLIFPGHETTVARMDFGLMYLLNERRWKDWLMEDPEGRIGDTVEEILRLTSAHNLGLLRWAVEEIEIGGVTIQPGDLVIISESAASRDPKIWDDPETFDPTRPLTPHASFGHGGHICLGQSLARTELRIVFPSLFRRFPNIRLAEDVGDLFIRDDRTGGGVDRVLVTWW
jgi:cytochrome P450